MRLIDADKLQDGLVEMFNRSVDRIDELFMDDVVTCIENQPSVFDMGGLLAGQEIIQSDDATVITIRGKHPVDNVEIYFKGRANETD